MLFNVIASNDVIGWEDMSELAVVLVCSVMARDIALATPVLKAALCLIRVASLTAVIIGILPQLLSLPLYICIVMEFHTYNCVHLKEKEREYGLSNPQIYYCKYREKMSMSKTR